jgi:hypothetical protein
LFLACTIGNVKYFLPGGLFPPSSRRSGIGFVHDALLQLVFELGHSAGTVMHEKSGGVRVVAHVLFEGGAAGGGRKKEANAEVRHPFA